MRTLVSAFVLALASSAIDPGIVEDDVKAELEKKKLKVKSISCPKNKPAKKGASFECTGETKAGDDLTVEVEVTSNTGDIKWELVGRIVDPEEIEGQLKKQGAGKADCGDDVRAAVKGTKIECDVEGQKVTIKFKDAEGSWEAMTN